MRWLGLGVFFGERMALIIVIRRLQWAQQLRGRDAVLYGAISKFFPI